MIEIGKVNKLIVASSTDAGIVLQDPETDQVVLLPRFLMPAETPKLKSSMEVFVYMEPNDRKMLASPEIPVAMVGEYALLRVVETQEFGAFLDWGIEKDLLVPGNEQKEKVRTGEKRLVRICLEEDTNRIYGTTKLGKYIESSEFDIKETDKVQIQPVEESDLGYRCIVNKKFIGMIYHNEIFTPIHEGETYAAVVKKIREDGLVDLAMQTQGARNLFESKDKVLAILIESGGKTSLTDKSSPEEIKRKFGMSKKSFKSAVGMLYKDRKIVIGDDGISVAKR